MYDDLLQVPVIQTLVTQAIIGFLFGLAVALHSHMKGRSTTTLMIIAGSAYFALMVLTQGDFIIRRWVQDVCLLYIGYVVFNAARAQSLWAALSPKKQKKHAKEKAA